jgi:glutamine synthetase type III
MKGSVVTIGSLSIQTELVLAERLSDRADKLFFVHANINGMACQYTYREWQEFVVALQNDYNRMMAECIAVMDELEHLVAQSKLGAKDDLN